MGGAIPSVSEAGPTVYCDLSWMRSYGSQVFAVIVREVEEINLAAESGRLVVLSESRDGHALVARWRPGLSLLETALRGSHALSVMNS